MTAPKIPARARLGLLTLPILAALTVWRGPFAALRARLAGSAEILLAKLQPLPERHTASGHPMQYYLSLPAGWTPGRTWPIVVTVDGADHDFLTLCRTFMRARGDRPFIVVTPFVLSNGGHPDPKDYPYPPAVWRAIATGDPLPFDVAGILAIIADIQRERGGQFKVFLTGFSAGGHLTWLLAFTHPEVLAAVAPACANYAGRGLTAVSLAPGRKTLPITAFQGDADPLLSALTQQWEAARRTAEANGYTNLTHELVHDAGHSPLAGHVLTFFATLLP